jgi:hypothetical protein
MQTRPIGRIPAIVFIHGGPDDHVDPLYLSNVQFLAKRGFIIVVPKVRGSTGLRLTNRPQTEIVFSVADQSGREAGTHSAKTVH